MTWVFRKAEIFGISRRAAARMRIRFLLEDIEIYEKTGGDIEKIWIDEAFDEIFYLFKHLPRTMENKNKINDYDIAMAKEYPIENLIQFDRNGNALAWCHEDKKPSLKLWRKKNRAKCWHCNLTFDPIAVLMERDNLNFIEAVKMLI